MAIHKNRFGEFEVECDQCGFLEDVDTGDDWQALMEWMRAEGWEKTKTRDDEWEHYCPRCAG